MDRFIKYNLFGDNVVKQRKGKPYPFSLTSLRRLAARTCPILVIVKLYIQQYLLFYIS